MIFSIAKSEALPINSFVSLGVGTIQLPYPSKEFEEKRTFYNYTYCSAASGLGVVFKAFDLNWLLGASMRVSDRTAFFDLNRTFSPSPLGEGGNIILGDLDAAWFYSWQSFKLMGSMHLSKERIHFLRQTLQNTTVRLGAEVQYKNENWLLFDALPLYRFNAGYMLPISAYSYQDGVPKNLKAQQMEADFSRGFSSSGKLWGWDATLEFGVEFLSPRKLFVNKALIGIGIQKKYYTQIIKETNLREEFISDFKSEDFNYKVTLARDFDQ